MKLLYDNYDARGVSDRSYISTGLLAFIFSLLVHLFIFYHLWSLRLPWAGQLKVEQNEKWLVPVTVDKVMSKDVQEVKKVSGANSVSLLASLEEEALKMNEKLVQSVDNSDKVVAEDIREKNKEIAFDKNFTTMSLIKRPMATWQARQEIMAVEENRVKKEIEGLKRRRIPKIERVDKAPDITIPLDSISMHKENKSQFDTALSRDITVKEKVAFPDIILDEKSKDNAGGLKEEMEIPPPSSGQNIKPIESFLTATLEAYKAFMDPYVYFRMEIRRISEDILPVIPRDIVFVQDCSASMSEERLHFCREGLKKCLTMLKNDERFNVIAFKDTAEKCFEDWASVTPDSIAKAANFIDGLHAGGNTDIYKSLVELMKLSMQNSRAPVAIVITDGRPTTGILASSDIITGFTGNNKGMIPVFTVGTIQTANAYLLDLLAYCNRGESLVIKSGRWDIPLILPRINKEVSRPVLKDIRFQFAGELHNEVFPVDTTHLYLDKPLLLYGRCSSFSEKIVFRASGISKDGFGDMVFNLSLNDAAKSGDSSIRKKWAEQKIYYLIAKYAEKRDPSLLNEMRRIANAYKVAIPYEKELPSAK